MATVPLDSIASGRAPLGFKSRETNVVRMRKKAMVLIAQVISKRVTVG